MGSISARQSPRKNKRREKIPRRVAGLIARDAPESRQNGPKTGQNQGFGGGRRVTNGEMASARGAI
jgi:hypothetical protein